MVVRLLFRLFTKLPRPVLYTFAGFGACYAVPALVDPCFEIYHQIYGKPLDFPTRYGAGSWVVISGGTDGMGEVFAQEFAKMGFNIAIIGRNAEKLQKVTESLHALHKVQVLSVQFDLSQSITQQEALLSLLRSSFDHLDVSLLINNAGVRKAGLFEEESYGDLSELINVNCASHTFISRYFLPKMRARTLRSGVINVSSVLAKLPLGYISGYSASKAYLRALSLAIREETKGKVDVLTVCPGEMNTNMIGKPGESISVVSPETAVRASILNLGRRVETPGALSHYLMYSPLDYINERYARIISTSVFKRFFMRGKPVESTGTKQ